MQQRPQNVLRMLDNGPVVLSVRGKGAAVVASLAEWDRIAERLATLERWLLADERSRSDEWVTGDELDRELAKIGIS